MIPVLERAMYHFENCYHIPNVKVVGWVCKTNLPSNTAFRGFGGPQGMFAGEHIIRDVARIRGMDYVEIMRINFYKTGDRTHYNQQLENFPIERCLDDCLKQSNVFRKRMEIEEFNKRNRWRKRGISVVPTKFGIAFGVRSVLSNKFAAEDQHQSPSPERQTTTAAEANNYVMDPAILKHHKSYNSQT